MVACGMPGRRGPAPVPAGPPGGASGPVSRAASRSRSSTAALRLKVRTRIRSESPPERTRRTTDSTSVVVLPVPGPASTSSGPCRWSTTARWAASKTGGSTRPGAVRTRRYAPAVFRRAARWGCVGGTAEKEELTWIAGPEESAWSWCREGAGRPAVRGAGRAARRGPAPPGGAASAGRRCPTLRQLSGGPGSSLPIGREAGRRRYGSPSPSWRPSQRARRMSRRGMCPRVIAAARVPPSRVSPVGVVRRGVPSSR